MRHLKHLGIGFAAGFLVAAFTLVFLGLLPSHNDLNTLERHQQARALVLAFFLACGTGVFAMLFATARISKFWPLFFIIFGAMALIPFWKYKHNGGTFLPLGTPYVNFGYQSNDTIILIIHVVIASILAAIIQQVLPMLRRTDSSK